MVNNYQNITKTLAKRYQMRQCWEAQSSSIPNSEATPGSVTEIPLCILPLGLRQVIAENIGAELESAWETKRLEHDRVSYKVGDFFIFDLAHAEEIPVFLKLIHILKIQDEWKLCGRIFLSNSFSEHLHAYSVKSTAYWIALNPGDEADYHALDCYDIKDNLYISLQHRPVRKRYIIIIIKKIFFLLVEFSYSHTRILSS